MSFLYWHWLGYSVVLAVGRCASLIAWRMLFVFAEQALLVFGSCFNSVLILFSFGLAARCEAQRYRR